MLRLRAGDSFQPGAWTLGRHYKWVNPIAVAWIVLITTLFLMPTVPTAIPWHTGFNWNVVNYALLTVGGVLLAVGIWWALSARKWFKGPVSQGSEEEPASRPATRRRRPRTPSPRGAETARLRLLNMTTGTSDVPELIAGRRTRWART